MSLPQNMPKPPPKGLPPKALPPGRPPAAAAPAAAPVAAMPAAAVPAAPVAAAPPAPAVAQPAAKQAAPQPAAPRPAPVRAPMPPALAGLHPSMAAMVEAVQIYEALLIEENDMLRNGDSDGVAAILDRKMAATRLYQERQRMVLGDNEATRSLTDEQRGLVVTMVRGLEELARENTILLKANMGAIEQLFEVINTAARKMRKREVSYSKSGTMRDYHLAHQVSLAYNHTV